DRPAGRVRTREPSVPWTREAGPLACGRRGTSPRKLAKAERRFSICYAFKRATWERLPLISFAFASFHFAPMESEDEDEVRDGERKATAPPAEAGHEAIVAGGGVVSCQA